MFPQSCSFLWRDFGGPTALALVGPREPLTAFSLTTTMLSRGMGFTKMGVQKTSVERPTPTE